MGTGLRPREAGASAAAEEVNSAMAGDDANGSTAQPATEAPEAREELERGSLRLEVENDFSDVESKQMLVQEFLRARDCPASSIYTAELVFEEIVTNVVRHGFDDPGRHLVVVRVGLTGDKVSLEFSDDGRPFDPTAAPLEPLAESIEDARIGGLGMRLVRSMATSIRYSRVDARNLLAIEIALEAD